MRRPPITYVTRLCKGQLDKEFHFFHPRLPNVNSCGVPTSPTHLPYAFMNTSMFLLIKRNACKCVPVHSAGKTNLLMSNIFVRTAIVYWTRPICCTRGALHYPLRACFVVYALEGEVHERVKKPIPQFVHATKHKSILIRFPPVVGRVFASENPSHNARFSKPWNGFTRQRISIPSPSLQCWVEDPHSHLRNFCRSIVPPAKLIKDGTPVQHWVGGKGIWNSHLIRVLLPLAKIQPTPLTFFISISCVHIQVQEKKIKQCNLLRDARVSLVNVPLFARAEWRS